MFAPLVHLSRPPREQLPRGECRFILPDVAEDGTRQRCTCVAFSLSAVGAQCGCGHQAWHHIPESSVPLDEHLAVLDRLKRVEDAVGRLEDRLVRERRDRDKAVRDLVQMLRASYGNMACLKYYADEKLEMMRVNYEDKLEGVLDKATAAAGDLEELRLRVGDIDESVIRLEERLERSTSPEAMTAEPTPAPPTPAPVSAKLPSLPATPAAHRPLPTLPPLSSLTASVPLPIRDKPTWSVRVILVPKKTQHFAFPPDSTAFLRCQSRGLHQDITLDDRSATTFTHTVEAVFATILRGRPWTPLQCLRSSDMELDQLPPDQRQPVLWDYGFLESQCMAHDKAVGDIIYIALAYEELSWVDVHNLPRVFGSNENCWEHEGSLDGGASIMSKDSDSMYEYSPPPYESRAAIRPRLPESNLMLLATASSYANSAPSLSDRSVRTAPSISDRSVLSDTFTENSHISSLSLGDNPLGDVPMREPYDEHRDKRTKRTALRPLPPATGLYYSGRAKRKMSNPAKQKEPLDWRVSELKMPNPVRGLLHRRESGGKNAAAAAAAVAEQQRMEEGQ
ncbi:hypothetical protein EJ06DRAFT_530153 [Trichodelitschia bisporula]|uniref:Uncharacterized protein n=1 Tax=Trichodelitschia bisporula TaxID=703511 RepID=A0A6G1HWD9_9PEZI|nr:hypothetical protein EJ06DRAFT_530153 [Trichodelitschia bisporula]